MWRRGITALFVAAMIAAAHGAERDPDGMPIGIGWLKLVEWAAVMLAGGGIYGYAMKRRIQTDGVSDSADRTARAVLMDTIHALQDEVASLRREIGELKARIISQQHVLLDVLRENHELRGLPPPNFDPSTDMVADMLAKRASPSKGVKNVAEHALDHVSKDYPDMLPPRVGNGWNAQTVPAREWDELNDRQVR
jgi:hypothetical protein